MTDIYDQATDHEMHDREMVLQVIRAQAQTQPRLTANGLCHNCGEVVADSHTFCDHNCRDDWQLRNQRNK